MSPYRLLLFGVLTSSYGYYVVGAGGVLVALASTLLLVAGELFLPKRLFWVSVIAAILTLINGLLAVHGLTPTEIGLVWILVLGWGTFGILALLIWAASWLGRSGEDDGGGSWEDDGGDGEE